MAPITSDLIQIARKNIEIEPKMLNQQSSAQTTPSNIGPSNHSCLTVKPLDKKEPTSVTPSTSIQQNSNKIPLKLVNAHITCSICNGYLIDATTLVECLHSFCHSCIMKHLRIQDYCPKCDVLVNKAKLNIKPDTTLQAIVYKLVPELYEKELLRRRAFYKMCPKEAALATPDQRGEDTENLIFSPKEALSLSLEYSNMEELPKKSELSKPIYLQCPAIFKVSNLKKFVLSKFGIDGNLLSVELMYKVKTIVLPDHYTLMDIAYIYIWKRDAPMRFFFRVIKNSQPTIQREQKSDAMLKPLPLKHKTISNDIDKKNLKSKQILTEVKNIECEKNNNSVSSMFNKDKNVDNNSGKQESIKLKIELSKQGNMVSILNSGSPPASKIEEKQELTTTNKHGKPTVPKLLLLKSKALKSSNGMSENAQAKIKIKGSLKKLVKNLDESTKNKLQIIAGKSLKLSSESQKESENKNILDKNVPEIDPKKSEFLNTFQLAPRKIVHSPMPSKSPQKSLRPIAPKAPIPSLKPLSACLGTLPKRKNKDTPKQCSANNNFTSNKKSKSSDLKQILEKIIREKNNQSAVNDKKETISFNLAPFPIGSSKIEDTQKSPLTLSSISLSTPATYTSPKTSEPKCSSMNQNVTASNGEPYVNNSLTSVLHNNIQKQQKIVSNPNNVSNNISPKQIVPKRPVSPNTENVSEPVFKKPMIMAKKSSTTPEKPKILDSQKNSIKKTDASKKVFAPPSLPLPEPHNMPFTPPHKPSNYRDNYLNFALMNATKSSEHNRIPRAPIFSPFSPVYAPNSPKYTPNFNLQSKPTFKYTNPQAYASLMENLYKSNNLFPANVKTTTYNSPQLTPPKNISNDSNSNKSPHMLDAKTSKTPNKSVTPITCIPPTHNDKNKSPTISNQDNKKSNASSLLDKLNFPSSLSVTLTTDTDDSRTNSPSNKNHSTVNNYIEIVKLPESPTNINNNKTIHANGAQSSGNKTPPGCISPPKTIIKIDDVKKLGENVHKDIINKVNEMCSNNSSAPEQSDISKTKIIENIVNKENGSCAPSLPISKSNSNEKETFQTKFLESILPKLNDKVSKENSERSKATNITKTYSKANPVANQGDPVPLYSKAVQNKLGELRKISPKPSQNQSNINNPLNKTSLTVNSPTSEKNYNPQLTNSNVPANYQAYDPTKLANLFSDFAQVSQNPIQNLFPGIAGNQITAFNAMPMVNIMQQAYLMEHWQKLQKLQKSAEQNYIENCMQTLKQNNNQTSSNRLE